MLHMIQRDKSGNRLYIILHNIDGPGTILCLATCLKLHALHFPTVAEAQRCFRKVFDKGTSTINSTWCLQDSEVRRRRPC